MVQHIQGGIELGWIILVGAEAYGELDPEVRRVKIRKNVELQKYGYTPGCEGCSHAELGTASEAPVSPCMPEGSSATVLCEPAGSYWFSFGVLQFLFRIRR